jgi:hypothetical protein
MEADFEGELLPGWSQLLDVAARMVPISDSSLEWFARFGRGPGVDDSGTVREHCAELEAALVARREQVIADLQNHPGDGQAVTVWEAWVYSLETMGQRASAGKTCRWRWVGEESEMTRDWDGDGEIKLLRP